MDYKLAKKLKDAGFPQKWYEGAEYYSIGTSVVTGKPGVDNYAFCHEFDYANDMKDAVRIPTLSELIEACGDGFGSLHKDNDVIGGWIAYDARADISARGSSPEEAVAKL